jgi:hypothetical protein
VNRYWYLLVMRVENKTMPVYDLTKASGGPKLQKSPGATITLDYARLKHPPHFRQRCRVAAC